MWLEEEYKDKNVYKEVILKLWYVNRLNLISSVHPKGFISVLPFDIKILRGSLRILSLSEFISSTEWVLSPW